MMSVCVRECVWGVCVGVWFGCVGSVVLDVWGVWCWMCEECGVGCVGSVVLDVWGVVLDAWEECGVGCVGSGVRCVGGVWCWMWGECGGGCVGRVVLTSCSEERIWLHMERKAIIFAC